MSRNSKKNHLIKPLSKSFNLNVNYIMASIFCLILWFQKLWQLFFDFLKKLSKMKKNSPKFF